MNLAPSDAEKLLLAVAGIVARDRLDRGVKLNYPESVALAQHLGDRAGPGGGAGRGPDERGPRGADPGRGDGGVAEMITDVQVEATFPDGRKLVTLHQPIQ